MIKKRIKKFAIPTKFIITPFAEKKRSTNKSTLLEATFNPETDDCNSDAAKRAIKEHLGNNLELANGIYLHDQKINHWAYKSSRDKIHATFMFVEFLWGHEKFKLNSDYEFRNWISIDKFSDSEFVPELEEVKEKILSALEKI